jgi:hypothetical protein
MTYTYCKECGHKNLYATQIPKFCNSCGAPLGLAAGVASPKKTIGGPNMLGRKKRTKPIEGEVEEDFDQFSNADSVPNIVDFKCSSSVEGFNRKIKLEDLIQIEEGELIEKTPKRKSGRQRKQK